MGRFDIYAKPDEDRVRVAIRNDVGERYFFETDSATAIEVALGILAGAQYNEHVKCHQKLRF